MQLLVMGMHRSGTSALTGVLSLCGAYVGTDDRLLTPSRHNPKGFWEICDVKRLNDLLLHDMGCDWQRVLALGARQPTAAALAAFHAGASTVVGDLERFRPWAMKDPRLCITLPWWRPHLEAPVCILTHRNPVEIARSLAARNRTPEPFGVALWERYMQMALSATSGLPRIVIGHDRLLRQPVETTARLIETLKGLGVTGMEMPDSATITGFIDSALHRHAADDAELEGALTCEQRALHVSLRDGNDLDHYPGTVHDLLLDGGRRRGFAEGVQLIVE